MEIDQAALIQQTRTHLFRVPFDSLQTTPITHGGSGRTFYRLRCQPRGETFILMRYDLDRADNKRFVPVTHYLERELSLSVPQLHAFCETERLVWLQDLGEIDLWSQRKQPWPLLEPIYQNSLDEVWKIHAVAEHDISCELEPPFDAKLYLWEQHYFFDNFLSHQSRFSLRKLEELIQAPEWEDLANSLAELPRFLVHRDFQSRNIMIHNGSAYLIDYQGLRWGRPEYDLASIVLDPYIDLDDRQRERLLRYYHQRYRTDSWENFYQIYHQCAAQRLMQALGAYGHLGRNLGKKEFLDFIPIALPRLRKILADGNLMPRLQQALEPTNLTLH